MLPIDHWIMFLALAVVLPVDVVAVVLYLRFAP